MGSSSSLASRARSTAIILGLLCSIVRAETIAFYAPHAGPPILIDSENAGIHTKLPGPPQIVVGGGKGPKAGNLVFNLTFADVVSGTGVGFDDPVLGATRRATAQVVAGYLSKVLNENSGATIAIDFTVSETDGTGFIAYAGSYWPLSPNQYHGGWAWSHILTGADPSGSQADIFCMVDFGYTWNSEFDDPAGSEYDLPSVLLHEFTHGLGFLGLTYSNGNSAITNGNPGVFSFLTDRLLRQTGALDLWNASFTFTGAPGDLISNDVVFTGTNATAANGGTHPKMYCPVVFVDGSSLSHWDSTTYPNSVMKHIYIRGQKTRQFHAFEIGALRDIGYVNAADPGVPVPVELSEFSAE